MRRPLLISGVAVLVLGGAAAGYVLTRGSGSTAAAADPGRPPATATVIKTTLVQTTTASGTLGYGDPIPVRAAQPGTVTWLAPLGATVRRGQPLFKVDQHPVVDLYGSLPLYRPLREGTTGRDVRELERNLAALGYRRLTVDGTYTAATAAAVRAWQGRLGLPATGTVVPGQAVFTPGPIRIADRTAQVGDMIGGPPGEGGGSLLSYTNTARQVTVDLDVADQALAVKGRTVTVTLPGGQAVKGKISQVGSVITTQDAGSGGPPDATASAAAQTGIDVTVTIPAQKALGSLQAAVVDVQLSGEQRKDVLAVPVAALLALPEGGFGVQIVNRATTRLVPVRTGMFAGGQVQISGSGIAQGVRVGVPR